MKETKCPGSEVPPDDRGCFVPIQDVETGKIKWGEVFTTEEAQKEHQGKKPDRLPIDITPPSSVSRN